MQFKDMEIHFKLLSIYTMNLFAQFYVKSVLTRKLTLTIILTI